jgi:hypothetical protein
MAETITIDDLDFLQELVDTPDPPKGTRTRKPKDTRDTETWFKLDHIVWICRDCNSKNTEMGYSSARAELSFPTHCLDCNSTNVTKGYCSRGDNCLGLIEDEKGPERVTAIVNGIEMCRWDFLDGLAHVPE